MKMGLTHHPILLSQGEMGLVWENVNGRLTLVRRDQVGEMGLDE